MWPASFSRARGVTSGPIRAGDSMGGGFGREEARRAGAPGGSQVKRVPRPPARPGRPRPRWVSLPAGASAEGRTTHPAAPGEAGLGPPSPPAPGGPAPKRGAGF